ncbi:hypothetical protein MC885_019917 [Smutsia gigantea]|nr:hypothetical protein MC885_019917 [Smutsia gigantea]
MEGFRGTGDLGLGAGVITHRSLARSSQFSSWKQRLSPKHPARLSSSPGHLPLRWVPDPHGLRRRREGSGKEDHKDDEEDNEDEEDFDHEPPVGGDRLEVLEDL